MMNRNKDTIIERIEELSVLIGGTVRKSKRNYRGRLSKVIEIEYDIEV
tara:strand:- start:378 stop:521 length:144 start_codon:yes stop_codon:yes gene_type:complete